MRTVCIFIHYSPLPEIPYYVIRYVRELEKQFDEVIVMTNRREIANKAVLESPKTELRQTENEGYDFGMFYKAYQSLDKSKYRQIACVNDSTILLSSLQPFFAWMAANPADVWGLMEADIRPAYATHSDSRHLQSYFLVFNQTAFGLVDEYLKRLDVDAIFKEKDLKRAKQWVINYWEIGLSQFLLGEGLTLKACYLYNDFLEKQPRQPYAAMLQGGVPVLKKKVITSVKPRDIFAGKSHWKKLIRQYAAADVDVPQLVKELEIIRQTHWKNRLKG